jgi:tetratricopeptide (TPR) repeat protein
MKSLEKDRTRRYDTASTLAMDVQRHLNEKPVEARAPRAMYRLQKFVLRHKSQITVTLVIAALVGASVATSLMWHQKRAQRRMNDQFEHGRVLSEAHDFLSNGDALAALEKVESILNSKHVGVEAKLLYAKILLEGRQPGEAMSQLGDLLHESPEVADVAGSLLARILWEGEPGDSEELSRLDEYRQKAQEMLEGLLDEAPETAGYASLLLARILLEDESINEDRFARVDELKRRANELLPKSAEAYFFRATMAFAIKDKLDLLERALQLDPGHYDCLKLRALIYYASRQYESMKDEARIMIALKPMDPLGYSLCAVAWQELNEYGRAIDNIRRAIKRTPEGDARRTRLWDQLCRIHLGMGNYGRAISDAQEYLTTSLDRTIPQFHVFCALTAQGKYEEAVVWYIRIGNSDPDSRRRFRDLSMRYVFDTLAVGRSWHPPQSRPEGAAFLAMLEAEEIYHSLEARSVSGNLLR